MLFRSRRQLISVPSPAYFETQIAALKMLVAERTMAVHSKEELDEISICGPWRIATLSGGDIARDRITPEAAGLPAHVRDAIRGGDAAFNAQALRKLLAGERSAYRDAVLMNAADRKSVV